MAKRSFEEVEKFDEVDKGIPSASVYGVLTSLSPVKKGRKQNYFEGTVSDGSNKLRLVGFVSNHQKKCLICCQRKKPLKSKIVR